MDIGFCKKPVKELREIAKQMGLSTTGLKKCEILLLIERNSFIEEEPEINFPRKKVSVTEKLEPEEQEIHFKRMKVIKKPEEQEEEPEINFPRKKRQTKVRFGENQILEFIADKKTKGKPVKPKVTVRKLSEEDLKSFVPRRRRQKMERELMSQEDFVPEISFKRKPVAKASLGETEEPEISFKRKPKPKQKSKKTTFKDIKDFQIQDILSGDFIFPSKKETVFRKVKDDKTINLLSREYQFDKTKYNEKEKKLSEGQIKKMLIMDNLIPSNMFTDDEMSNKEILNFAEDYYMFDIARKDGRQLEAISYYDDMMKSLEPKSQESTYGAEAEAEEPEISFKRKPARQMEIEKMSKEDFNVFEPEPEPEISFKRKPKPKQKSKTKKQLTESQIKKAVQEEFEKVKKQIKSDPEDYDEIMDYYISQWREYEKMKKEDPIEYEDEINKNPLEYEKVKYIFSKRDVLLPKKASLRETADRKTTYKEVTIKNKKEFDKRRSRSNPSFKYVYDMINDEGRYNPSDETASYIVETLMEGDIIK